MDDDELLRSARSNDLDAASELLSRHQNVAYTAALRLVGDSAEAEDVTQEALVRAYTNLASLQDGASFAHWLRRIAVNLSLNVLRRRGLIRFESLEPAPDDGRAPEYRDDAPSPELQALVAEERDTIESLVRRLPADQRVAVVLRDMYGYDMNDVAAIGRCGLSAAKMRVKRGREALRDDAARCGARPYGDFDVTGDSGEPESPTRDLLRASGAIEDAPPVDVARGAVARLRGRRRAASNVNELFRIVQHFFRGFSRILGSPSLDEDDRTNQK